MSAVAVAQTVSEPTEVKKIRAAYQQAQKIIADKNSPQMTLNTSHTFDDWRSPSTCAYKLFFQKSGQGGNRLIFARAKCGGHEFSESAEYLFDAKNGQLLFYFNEGGEGGESWENRLYYQNGKTVFYRLKNGKDDGSVNDDTRTGTVLPPDAVEQDKSAQDTARKLMRAARDFM